MNSRRLQCRITFTQHLPTDKIGDASGQVLVFNIVNNVKIERSYKNLTQTAKITLPRNIQYTKTNIQKDNLYNNRGNPLADGVNSVFKRGDKVKIELGYFTTSDKGLRTVFVGYIARVLPNSPVVLECEDSMWVLKQAIVTYPSKNQLIIKSQGKNGKALKRPKVIGPKITLGQLLDNIIPGEVSDVIDIDYNINLGTLQNDVNIGQFIINKASVAKSLEELYHKYGFYSYFDLPTSANANPILQVGFGANAVVTNVQTFGFQDNIIDYSNLLYQRADDIKLKVTAISIDSKTNAKIQVDVGDPDGEQRTFHTTNCSKADLTVFANLKLSQCKYEGYTGHFLTFGEPYVEFGDAVKLTNKAFPDTFLGTYSVVGVTREFGLGGYRQQIELGVRLGSASLTK